MEPLDITLLETDKHPEFMSLIVQPFSANDYAAAQLNANTRANYETTEKAAQKIASLSDFAFRRVVMLGDTPVGSLSLMDQNATRFQRAVRRIGLDLSKSRTFNGWFDLSKVNYAKTVFSTEVLSRTLDVASDQGLQHVETVVSEEKADKNSDLIVVEHTAKIRDLGFRKIGHVPVKDQGRTYVGTRYRIDL